MQTQINRSANGSPFLAVAAEALGDIESITNPLDSVDDTTTPPAKPVKSDLAPVSDAERAEAEAFIAGLASAPDLTAAVNPAAIARQWRRSKPGFHW